MTDSREALTPDMERALEDARRLADERWKYESGPSFSGRYHIVTDACDEMVCECHEGSEDQQEDRAQAICRLPDIARQLLAEHARAVRLAEELSESTDKARAWDKVSEKNARITALEAQVERLHCEKAVEIGRAMDAEEKAAALEAQVAVARDALKAAEEWLNGWASAEPYLSKIRTALNTVDGDRT